MDVLRVPALQHDWLQQLSRTDLIPVDRFREFVEDVVSSFFDLKRPIGIVEQNITDSEKQLSRKQAVAGLCSLLIEASKKGSADDAVGLYLQAIGIPEEQSKIIVAVYSLKKHDLRELLSKIGFCLPQVVDVDWSLDYTCTRKDGIKSADPKYRLNLQTFSVSEGVQDIPFSARREDLQDMLYKLKEAAKAVERLQGS